MPDAFTSARARASASDIRVAILDAITVGAVVMAAALFGILTRPGGLLASFWPANAVLLGLMIRFPRFMTPMAWAAATIGLLAADFMTGGGLLRTVLLTTANLTGVLAGALLYRRLPATEAPPPGTLSVPAMTLAAIGAAAAAGVVGAVIGPILFDGTPFRSFLMWSVTELVNYIALLPMMLSLPKLERRTFVIEQQSGWPLLRRALPLIALVVSLFVSLTVGGPGALAFPVPALLWCAISYSVFVTAVLTLAFSAWTLTVMSADYFNVPFDLMHPAEVLSIRLAVTLIALAPIVAATMMSARDQLLDRLKRQASYDGLTDTLTRTAFHERAAAALAASTATTNAVLMLDIDNFKSINDSHGHAAGDVVLAEFARRARSALRDDDLIGRFGGEEFAVLLPASDAAQAGEIAERIRARFARAGVRIPNGRTIAVTVSIGGAIGDGGARLESLLESADAALYEAKRSGRDRVIIRS